MYNILVDDYIVYLVLDDDELNVDYINGHFKRCHEELYDCIIENNIPHSFIKNDKFYHHYDLVINDEESAALIVLFGFKLLPVTKIDISIVFPEGLF